MKLTFHHRSLVQRIVLIAAFCAAIIVVTRIALQFGSIANAPTVGFSFLILVALAAFLGDLPVAILTSIVAALCFNYFFFPPIGTFNIYRLDDWVSVVALLLTSIAISQLTASARIHGVQAARMDKTLSRLKEFGVWLLSVPHDRLSLTEIAEKVLQIFSLEYCSIHVFSEEKWHHFTGAAKNEITREIAGRLKFLEDHPTNLMELVDEHALGVRYQQINQGMTPLALLVVKGEPVATNALGTLAYMIGVRLMEMLQDKQSLPLKETEVRG